MAGNRVYDKTRFENLVLYLSSKSTDDEGYGKVKLNKLLFRADFEAYRLLGASISGEEYKRQELGPVAAHLPSLLRRFEEGGVLTIEEIPAGPYVRLVPTLGEGYAPNLSVFEQSEVEIIDRSLAELRAHGAKSVSEWSHEESVGWRLTPTNQVIPYDTSIIVSEPPPEKTLARLRERVLSGNWG
jgi:hypothetical protein